MGSISEAYLAFYDALDRIDAEKREPSAIEDRSLRTARSYLRSAPDLAVQILQTVPDTLSRNHAERYGDETAIRTLAEWREDLRSLAH